MEVNTTQDNSSSAYKLNSLAQRLVLDKLLDKQTAITAAQKAKDENDFFISYLVKHNILTPITIAHAASKDFGVPLLDIHEFDPDQLPVNLISEKLIQKFQAIPLYKKGNKLFVAMADPTNVQALTDIQFHTGLTTNPILVEEDKLKAFIDKALTRTSTSSLDDLDDSLEALDITNSTDDTEVDTQETTDDAPIVRFVNKIILDAINRGASDIHFEPFETFYRIRYRIDGLLYEVNNPPINLAPRIAARIKILANLDISERRIPQDGNFKMKLSANNKIDFRVNTCPVAAGEKIVTRILDAKAVSLGIENLGFEQVQQAAFKKVINEPQGMILVTGPTGSGKTVTLYSALNILNVVEKNISTTEDPVEMTIAGVNQVGINLKTGLTFSTALRAFLRQDPDIIMVGEIRDLETAEIAIKASQTGHLVLSTLHTNSAAETLSRLMNMGIEAFNIATSVSLIIAQRLARRLCKNCAIREDIPEASLLKSGFTPDEIKQGLHIHGPNIQGCEQCTHGYAGRVGLYEVMPITPEIGRCIMEGGNAINVNDIAIQQGVQLLRRSGLNKVKAGITSLEEVNRVTKD